MKVTTSAAPVPGADDQQAFLASVLGQGRTASDLDALIRAGYGRLLTAPAGTRVAVRAAAQTSFFVVLSGRLQVIRTRTDGSRHIIDVVDAGGACGAVTAFAPTPRWPADVHAARPARLLEVNTTWLFSTDPTESLAHLLLRQGLLQNCVRLLAERARNLNARSELLGRRSLRARLAFYLIRHADASGTVAGSLTRQELADHLQVSRASMTRELGRMVDAGLISVDGRVFRLRDRAAVSALAR
jgi:CRP-like cAMP-binding protein